MNRLAHETSPYLLQHAHNPVEWYPWGREALEKSEKENKPILISIGYSACHWCHVMEKESFENVSTATLMNKYFVCIKIDREERPDIDTLYMDAVQAMGVRGGWPLNVFLMPDQKPFYGGTYFPPTKWQELLENIGNAFQTHKKQLSASAEEFTVSISKSEIEKYGLEKNEQKYTQDDLEGMYKVLAKNFDPLHGGMQKAPKFPMPSLWRFLLHYAHLSKQEEATKTLHLTLDKIAFGGIQDHMAGGFARYSVDAEWFCPHFEKMLYDNAQLLTLYTEAYNFTQKPLYKQVCEDIIHFLTTELQSPEGGFYAAIDADSEGEEGKFYVWKKKEIETILGEESALFCQYYQVKEEGNWEFGNNILHRTEHQEIFAQRNQMAIGTLQEKIKVWREQMLVARNKRVRPSLDDKIITSWNGLAIKGFADAYKVFGNPVYLEVACRTADFIIGKMIDTQKGFLYRSYKNNIAKIQAYLDDYACVIEGLLMLFQVSSQSKYLQVAQKLSDYTIEHFYDTQEEMFFYTDNSAETLIARKKEIFDNVIPASNAIMAHNLYFLGIITDEPHYQAKAMAMLNRMKRILLLNIEYASHWGILFAYQLYPTLEIAIVGEKALEYRQELEKYFFPNKILIYSYAEEVNIPILQHKTALNQETTIYVCQHKTCLKPVHSVGEAIEQLKSIQI